MSDVKVYPVKPSEIVLSHDECGEVWPVTVALSYRGKP